MTSKKSKKVGIFNFKNWPEKIAQPTLGGHSASVVDDFIMSLDPGSNKRVVCLEVAPDAITLVRTKRKPRVDQQFLVAFDLYGSRTTEKSVASVCSELSYRDYLREMVEAATGRQEFNASSAGGLIAGRVFATGLGF
ncbi:hypothetical protein [Rhizobium leguminosarum]|uniref:hypothetical protein n=1 Tax=Rhizobium leguminosarum TaxID=384 RepID=UPI003F96E071